MQLNLEQKRLIQLKPNGHALIKGVAGSGKTTVAVQRIPFLLNHYCYANNDNILMVTYNKTLVNYLKYLYEKVDENLMDFSSLFGADNSRIDIFTVDSILFKYFNIYKRENRFKYEVITDNSECYSILAACISELEKKYSSVSILDHRNLSFLMDEIDWIKSCNYTESEEYLNADRLGRMSYQQKEGPQKLIKNSKTRKAIYELMLLYNKRLQEKGFIDFKDMAILALKQARKGVVKKYTHIIIDESQDLTRVQLELIKLLYNEKAYSSIYFIADTAQSIYPHSWLVKGRSFASIGFDMTGKSNTLTKNYRTTTQIAKAAYSLIENDLNIIDDENYVKPSLIDRQGEYPVYRRFKDFQEEINFIIREIRERLLSKYSYRDIVVIGRHRSQLIEINNYLGKVGIPCNIITRKDAKFEEDAVKCITMHSIKGLEFKVVFIVGINKGLIPYISYQDSEDENIQVSNERKLLYVGMTRASEILYLSSSGVPSPFLREINHKYLKINTYSKIKKYYDIALEDYIYKDKIFDLYSKEEKVRQWMIKELIDTYKYPIQLIDVEYKVNNFSAVGSVDVAISIHKNNNRIPYIFIETKPYGSGINKGLSQLKSYMSNCRTCQYGIVTDGNEFVVINAEHETVEDIPVFHTSMLPMSIEELEYVDLKHDCRYRVIRDLQEPSSFVVKREGYETSYSIDNSRNVKVYGNIAAGLPIYMNDRVDESIFIPEDWVKGQKECFMLLVRGDSMEGAGINNGDYVLIRRQQEAQNRDIVVVAIDDDATMKRLMKMGDTILLIPENEKYEPIQVRSDQVNILGIVIGVLKKV